MRKQTLNQRNDTQGTALARSKIRKRYTLASEDEEEKSAIECQMSYKLVDNTGEQTGAGDCKGSIDKEYLRVFPTFGDILPLHLRDIDHVETEEYRIVLSLSSKEKLVLSSLGHCFEDFLRVLTDLRNEVILKDLLMNEPIRKPDVNVDFTYRDEKGNENQNMPAKVRLYETAMVIIPSLGEIARVPYSDILNVSDENLSVKVSTGLGEQFVFQKLGSERDPFLREFSKAHDELQSKAVNSLNTLFPTIDSFSLRKIATIMKEGKAAKRSDIEAVNPKLWQELEKRLAVAGLNESYTYLKNLGRQEKMAIGFKRGLMGDLTGEYIWFLVPIYDAGDKDFGNAFAMEATEATGEASLGKATYFFKIMNRETYRHSSLEERDNEADRVIKTINRCMLEINFRREPVYLADEKLEEADYAKYRVAVQKIPSLQLLRSLYVGRVMHASPDQWKGDVMDLLRFNLKTQDERAKWEKKESAGDQTS
jgi:hypothetical protein